MKGNLLKISALKKNSEWCDKPEVLLYACFQILVDFIEKEQPQKIVDYKHNREQKKQWKELQTLYRYWKVDRPRLEKEVDRARNKWHKKYKWTTIPDPKGGPFSTHVTLKEDKRAWRVLDRPEQNFDQQEEKMLLRLIKIRHHLWC